ncbi:MAG: protein kinase [Anaerolineales bacterium]|nr:protein kinase [Anaerolineales bacterium]
MPLTIGQIIYNNRYRIDGLLGKGGMGAVYQAWDTTLETPVAIKENLDASPEAHRQFSKEARMLARISHPNLPRVIDYFFLEGQGQYLVMDFVEGEDLKAMLDRLGRLDEAQALTWIGQVCEALTYLHSQPRPIIHRDIKPANIRVRPDAQAMLVDFGIAKVYDAQLATTTGARAITPGFSPPEQYGSGHTDMRSDIYALGATLYAVLTGKTPVESVQRMITHTPLPMPRALNPAISPQVEAALIKAMAVHSNDRYQTVEQFRQALLGSSASLLVGGVRPPQPQSRPLQAAQPVAKPVATPVATPAPTLHTPALPPAPRQDVSIPAAEQTGLSQAVLIAAALGVGLALIVIIVAIGGLVGYSLFAPKSSPTAVLSSPSPTATLAATPSPTSTQPPPAYSGFQLAALVKNQDNRLFRSVAVEGSYLFTLARDGWLMIYDLSSLAPGAEMQLLASPAATQQVGNDIGLLISAKLLYVFGSDGLEVYALADPLKPALVATVKGDPIFSLAIQGDLLAAGSAGGVGLYDLSSPSQPKLIKRLELKRGGGTAYIFALAMDEDRHLFTSDFLSEDPSKAGLNMIDLSNPSNPVVGKYYEQPEAAHHLYLTGGQLITCSAHILQLWNVTDPANLVQTDSIDAQNANCALHGSSLVINGAAMKVLPGVFQPLATFMDVAGGAEEYFPYGTAVSGEYIFLAQAEEIIVIAAGQ